MVPYRVRNISLVILSIGALLTLATSVSFSQANAPDMPADSADVFLPLVVYHWPPPVRVLPNHSHNVSSIGTLRIFAEVQNDLSEHIEWVEVPYSLLDDSGQVVASDSQYVHLDVLAPGESTCFKILIIDPPAGWTRYELGDPTYRTGAEPLPKLTIYGDQGTYDTSTGWYGIEGQVRNDHGSRLEFIQVIAGLYDAAGTVLQCDWDFPDADELDPGESSDFEFDFRTLDDYAAVATYRLWADGDEQ
jgi:hypothetical protein